MANRFHPRFDFFFFCHNRVREKPVAKANLIGEGGKERNRLSGQKYLARLHRGKLIALLTRSSAIKPTRTRHVARIFAGTNFPDARVISKSWKTSLSLSHVPLYIYILC